MCIRMYNTTYYENFRKIVSAKMNSIEERNILEIAFLFVNLKIAAGKLI